MHLNYFYFSWQNALLLTLLQFGNEEKGQKRKFLWIIDANRSIYHSTKSSTKNIRELDRKHGTFFLGLYNIKEKLVGGTCIRSAQLLTAQITYHCATQSMYCIAPRKPKANYIWHDMSESFPTSKASIKIKLSYNIYDNNHRILRRW